jgi:hypothetical protein
VSVFLHFVCYMIGGVERCLGLRLFSVEADSVNVFLHVVCYMIVGEERSWEIEFIQCRGFFSDRFSACCLLYDSWCRAV